MRLYAFQGLRYGAPAGDSGRLAAPPFDQIGEGERRRLQDSDAHHFAHLTRPAGEAGEDPARHAARLHRDWLARGIVQRESGLALYLYEIRLRGGGRRLGLCGLLGLEAPETGIIRPHEQTVAGTVQERLALLRSTGVDLEPILVLCPDDGELEALLALAADRAEKVAEHQDRDGHRHLVYRIDERPLVVRLRRVLSSRVGLIADGHHRYQVARSFAAECGAAAGSAAAAKLAVVTSLASPGVAIEPIHRVLRCRVSPERAAEAASERRPWSGSGGATLAAAVAAAPQPAVGVRFAGHPAEIWRLSPERAPVDLPAAASSLAVVLLHAALLPRAGVRPEASTSGEIGYRSDPEALWGELEREPAAAGFWLPPIAPRDFEAAVGDGGLLPPKSTRFVPKLASGLVWAAHDSEVG